MMFLVAIFFCTSDSGLDNDDEQTRNFVMLERKGKKSSDVGNRTFSDSRLMTHDWNTSSVCPRFCSRNFGRFLKCLKID